jgi:hypothetical protein
LRRRRSLLITLTPFLCSFFAIENIRPSDFMLATAHQCKLNLILDVFDMNRT